MKKALYSFAMAIVMVAGSMMSSCTSSAKNNEEATEEKTEEVAECCPQVSDCPCFAGIELTQEQKDQLNALVPPCPKKCKKECEKAECDKAECDKAECEKAECEKAECCKEKCEKACEAEEACQAEACAKFFEDVKAILTPEQFEQFQANVEKMKAECPAEKECCKAEGENAEK